MNRSLPIAAIGLLVSLQLSAQQLCNQVFASNGGTYAPAQGMYMAYTIGEPVTFTATDGANYITQGFHQPEICLLTSVSDVLGVSDFSLEIWPNPSTDLLHMRFADPLKQVTYAQAFNLAGQLIELIPISKGETTTTLHVALWPAGVYTVQLRSADGLQLAAFKAIRQDP